MESLDDLDQFIIKSPANKSKSKYFLNHMNECLKLLSKIDEDMTNIINRINEIILNAVNIFPDKFNQFRYTNEVFFISNKYFNLFMKYQAIRFKDYNYIKQIINDFKGKISEYYEQNTPVQIKYSEFISFLSRKKDPSLPKMQFKLCSLFTYIKNLQIFEKNPKYTRKDLLLYIQKLSTKVDVQNNYISQNHFDLIFESYIESDEELFNAFIKIINTNDYDFRSWKFKKRDTKLKISKKDFDFDHINKSLIFNSFEYYMHMLNSKKKQKIKKSEDKKPNKINLDPMNGENGNNQTKKEFDLLLFNNLIQKVYFHITSSNQIDPKLFIVVRCSCLRFICNKYYISHEKEWFESIDDGYIQNCGQIIDQTPHELNISTDLIPSEFYDTSFRTLMKNVDYKNAIKRMFLIQFMTCPIDIWIMMKIAIDSSLKCINKLGNNEEKKGNISFDDFFSIVLPVLAASQIMCPKALHSFLSNFKCVSKSNSLDSTAVLSIALSGFIISK